MEINIEIVTISTQQDHRGQLLNIQKLIEYFV